MPDMDHPNFPLSSRWFAVTCMLITLVMLVLSTQLPLAVKWGGLLALAAAVAFNLRASWRGELSGSPLWPDVPEAEPSMVLACPNAHHVDADVWFAQALSGLAACLLALAVMLPLAAAA